MALIANLLTDSRRRRPFKPCDFNPYAVKEKAVIPAPLSVLRDVFVRKERK